MCVFRMYSKLTSDIKLYRIQSMSCSKSRRTTPGFLVLAGLKQGGATKWRVRIVTGFNCFVPLQGTATKVRPQFFTAVILRLCNFWGVMLCRCVNHSRILEISGRHASNKTSLQNWRPKSLECSLLLHFILPFTFYWFCTDIYSFELIVVNLLEFWSEAIRKLLFSSSFTCLHFQFLTLFSAPFR